MHGPIKNIQLEKVSGTKTIRGRVLVFEHLAWLLTKDDSMTFSFSPDFLEKAIRRAEDLGYERVAE